MTKNIMSHIKKSNDNEKSHNEYIDYIGYQSSSSVDDGPFVILISFNNQIK